MTISLHTYDMQALYIAFLEGSGRKNDAFKHILLLMKLQRKANKNMQNKKFSFSGRFSNPERKGFQNLFFTYFTEFRPFSQRKKILSAVLSFVRDGPILGPQLKASTSVKELFEKCFGDILAFLLIILFEFVAFFLFIYCIRYHDYDV